MRQATGRLSTVFRVGTLILCVLSVLLTGCAAARPLPPPRPATEADKLTVARALMPLLTASDRWSGPGGGCVAGLGILPTTSINLAVAPHPKCKFSLLITEGALETLSVEELQAALAHELGHVELGHFAARLARRQTEQRTDQNIESGGAIGSAAAGVIPGVGPVVAIGIMGAQMIAHFTSKGAYRAYDREEEAAADRYAAGLLEKVRPGGCRALIELFTRMQRETNRPLWASWLSTHPTMGSRLGEATSACPGP